MYKLDMYIYIYKGPKNNTCTSPTIQVRLICLESNSWWKFMFFFNSFQKAQCKRGAIHLILLYNLLLKPNLQTKTQTTDEPQDLVALQHAQKDLRLWISFATWPIYICPNSGEKNRRTLSKKMNALSKIEHKIVVCNSTSFEHHKLLLKQSDNLLTYKPPQFQEKDWWSPSNDHDASTKLWCHAHLCPSEPTKLVP